MCHNPIGPTHVCGKLMWQQYWTFGGKVQTLKLHNIKCKNTQTLGFVFHFGLIIMQFFYPFKWLNNKRKILPEMKKRSAEQMLF